MADEMKSIYSNARSAYGRRVFKDATELKAAVLRDFAVQLTDAQARRLRKALKPR
jgi:hypothetical protein